MPEARDLLQVLVLPVRRHVIWWIEVGEDVVAEAVLDVAVYGLRRQDAAPGVAHRGAHATVALPGPEEEPGEFSMVVFAGMHGSKVHHPVLIHRSAHKYYSANFALTAF